MQRQQRQVEWRRGRRKLLLDSCTAQRFRDRRFVGSGTLVVFVRGRGAGEQGQGGEASGRCWG